jgi:hypothetical protein
LYVASNGSEQVLRYNGRTGVFMDVFVPKGSGGLGRPTDLLFGPDGSLFALSSGFGTVFRYDGRTGAFLGALQDPGRSILDGVGGMALGPDGNLYVTSFITSSVLRFNPITGAFRDVFVAPGSGGLSIATGLTFGAGGDLYVVSKYTHQVLRYDGRTGAFLGVLFAGDPTALLYLPGQSPLAAGPPAAPTGLRATDVTSTQVRLTWDAGIPGATGIGVWRRSATSEWIRIADIDPGSTGYVDGSARPNTTYTYRIRAHTSTVVSAWSNELAVTTTGP